MSEKKINEETSAIIEGVKSKPKVPNDMGDDSTTLQSTFESKLEQLSAFSRRFEEPLKAREREKVEKIVSSLKEKMLEADYPNDFDYKSAIEEKFKSIEEKIEVLKRDRGSQHSMSSILNEVESLSNPEKDKEVGLSLEEVRQQSKDYVEKIQHGVRGDMTLDFLELIAKKPKKEQEKILGKIPKNDDGTPNLEEVRKTQFFKAYMERQFSDDEKQEHKDWCKKNGVENDNVWAMFDIPAEKTAKSIARGEEPVHAKKIFKHAEKSGLSNGVSFKDMMKVAGVGMMVAGLPQSLIVKGIISVVKTEGVQNFLKDKMGGLREKYKDSKVFKAFDKVKQNKVAAAIGVAALCGGAFLAGVHNEDIISYASDKLSDINAVENKVMGTDSSPGDVKIDTTDPLANEVDSGVVPEGKYKEIDLSNINYDNDEVMNKMQGLVGDSIAQNNYWGEGGSMEKITQINELFNSDFDPNNLSVGEKVVLPQVDDSGKIVGFYEAEVSSGDTLSEMYQESRVGAGMEVEPLNESKPSIEYSQGDGDKYGAKATIHSAETSAMANYESFEDYIGSEKYEQVRGEEWDKFRNSDEYQKIKEGMIKEAQDSGLNYGSDRLDRVADRALRDEFFQDFEDASKRDFNNSPSSDVKPEALNDKNIKNVESKKVKP